MQRAADVDMAEVLRQNRGLIFRYVNMYRRYLPPGTDVEDLVQAGRIGVYKASQTYNPTKAKWSTWAGVHIQGEIGRLVRHRRQQKPPVWVSDTFELHGEEHSLFDVLELESCRQDETAIWVAEFLQALPARDRQIVQMRLAGYTQQEIARRMGLSQAHIARITKRCGYQYLHGTYRKERKTMDVRKESLLEKFLWLQPHFHHETVRLSGSGIRIPGSLAAPLAGVEFVRIGVYDRFLAIQPADSGWRLKEDSHSRAGGRLISGKRIVRLLQENGFPPGLRLDAQWQAEGYLLCQAVREAIA